MADDDPLNHDSTPWMNKITIFTANHHTYIHVNSHQLADSGQLKKGITPSPNYAIAHANAWADTFATKLTKPCIPQQALLHPPNEPPITHPPILHLQYIFHHDNKIVTDDTNTYVAQQFANEITARYKRTHKDG